MPPASTEQPSALARWATQLESAPSECRKTCCFDERLAAIAASPQTSLETNLARANSPTERAIAIHQAASRRDLSDIPLIETALDENDFAWRIPWSQTFMMQRVALCPKVDEWRQRTLGQVALSALSQIIGRRFKSKTAYQGWRAAHPKPQTATSIWQSRVPREENGAACDRFVADLAAMAEPAAQDKELLLRLSVALHHRFNGYGPARCVSPARVASHTKGVLALLEVPGAWRPDPDPSYADQTQFEHLAEWAFLGTPPLIDDAARLSALSKSAQIKGSDRLFGLLSLAVHRLDPARGAKLIERAAQRGSVPLELVRTYARLRPGAPKTQAWLSEKPASFCGVQSTAAAAVLGLGEAGAKGRNRLKAVAGRKDLLSRPLLLSALAEAAVTQGANVDDLKCRKKLRPPDCLKLTREGRTKANKVFEQERARCLERARRFLLR